MIYLLDKIIYLLRYSLKMQDFLKCAKEIGKTSDKSSIAESTCNNTHVLNRGIGVKSPLD